MRIIAIVGISEAGKTSLLTSLLEEFTQRGLSCGALKRAAEEIELDQEGKDSERCFAAGAEKVAVLSATKFFLLQKERKKRSILGTALDYFPDLDILLVEGGKKERELKKVVVASSPDDINMVEPKESIVAVVAPAKLPLPYPVFLLSETRELADFLLKTIPPVEPAVQLKVNSQSIPLNPFVETIFRETMLGMLRSLKGLPDAPRQISLTLLV